MDIATPSWSFVPADLDPSDPKALEPLFDELRGRPIATVTDLEAWLRDESELDACISAFKARAYVRKTCHTEDEEAVAAYLHLEREVIPKVREWSNALTQRLLDLDLRQELPADRYGVLLRGREVDREIFRPENTALQAQEAELQTKTQAIMGGILVQFEGKEYTAQQMAPFFQDQDRGRREAAYTASQEARSRTWDELNGIYDQLIGLRDRMGRNAGLDGYTPFRFQQLHRFDYGPELCVGFHDAVAAAVVPAVQRLNDKRRAKLGVETLRPFDLDVDPGGEGPFQPFKDEKGLIQLCEQIFGAVDPRFPQEFGLLQKNGLLDLMSRKGKAPGGYQYQLEDIRLPFIFCNSVGTHQDVQTLLHEGGHAFHSILSREEELLAYRHAPIEFAETASMSMELMGLEELAGVYGDARAQKTRSEHLEGLLRILPWIATIDAFQHWVYANPGHERAAREMHWLELMDRFAPGIDHSGFEAGRRNRWTGQPHLFSHAFYYIEYGIAQLAALQIWQRYRQDKDEAVRAYREALALGGSKPLPELFATAGVRFDMSESMMRDLVADVEAAMDF